MELSENNINSSAPDLSNFKVFSAKVTLNSKNFQIEDVFLTGMVARKIQANHYDLGMRIVAAEFERSEGDFLQSKTLFRVLKNTTRAEELFEIVNSRFYAASA